MPKEMQVQRAVQNSFMNTLMQPDLPQHQSRNRRLQNQNQKLQNFLTDVAGSQTFSQIKNLQKLETGLQTTSKAASTFRNASSMNILNPADEQSYRPHSQSRQPKQTAQQEDRSFYGARGGGKYKNSAQKTSMSSLMAYQGFVQREEKSKERSTSGKRISGYSNLQKSSIQW